MQTKRRQLYPQYPVVPMHGRDEAEPKVSRKGGCLSFALLALAGWLIARGLYLYLFTTVDMAGGQ